jgi:protein SCO1/2
MRQAAFLFSIIILTAVGSFVAGWYSHPELQNKESLPILGHAPEYTLINQLGHKVSSKSYNGKARVVTFLFPYCNGYCPLIAHNFVSLERVLKTAGIADRVQLIAFNVDPENTGPAQMKTFQMQY